jgi:hypothetical protein
MPTLGKPQTYRLRRPGARPLIFSGAELAMAMNFTPELPYWYEINIYRTTGQRFVLAVRQFFQSETEEDTCQAWEFETLPEVFDAIEQYDPAKDIRVSMMDMAASAPAELTAMSLDLRAQVKAARANFSGLVGELFEELDRSLQASG